MNTSDNRPNQSTPRVILVEICLGTTCYVMGASDLEFLEEHLPTHLRRRVQIRCSLCLGCCKGRKYGAAPYVKINGETIGCATVDVVVQHLERLCGLSNQENA